MTEDLRTRLYVDRTHVWRPVTGIERVALRLFDTEALAPHDIQSVTARGTVEMIIAQQVAFIGRGVRERSAHFMFPGFPPSPASCLLGERCLMFVHDTFPLSRKDDLGRKARAYTTPMFRYAVGRLRRFFVNTASTGRDLRRYCRADALVALLRPHVPDVFGLANDRHFCREKKGPLHLLAIGTIEPRKNYGAALDILRALNDMGTPAELHIVGRVGWGSHPWLAELPSFVHMHGYVPDDQMRELICRSDLFISTSKAEGLGLPHLEVQHGGLPAVVPNSEVFAEVLDHSAVMIDADDPVDAACQIQAFMSDHNKVIDMRQRARENIARWNRLAKEDCERFRQFLSHGKIAYASAGQI